MTDDSGKLQANPSWNVSQTCADHLLPDVIAWEALRFLAFLKAFAVAGQQGRFPRRFGADIDGCVWK